MLVKAGSGALTFGHPDSLGVPADFAKHTLVLPFNETEPVKAKPRTAAPPMPPKPDYARKPAPGAGKPGAKAVSEERRDFVVMLGLMVNMRQHVVQGSGKLVLCCLSPRLMEVFRACSLERLFTITKSRAEALNALGGR